MSEERLSALESKLAFLEDTVDTLNNEMTEQGKRLESLRLLCQQIVEQQKSLADGAGDQGGAADEPPPHY
jgi:SlyX protein